MPDDERNTLSGKNSVKAFTEGDGIGIGGALLLLCIGLALLLHTCGRVYAQSAPADVRLWPDGLRVTDPVTKEWCCNAIDCAALTPTGVKPVNGGYLITETGEVIAHQRVIWKSPDGRWWRCRYLNDQLWSGKKSNMTRCLVGAPPGS